MGKRSAGGVRLRGPAVPSSLAFGVLLGLATLAAALSVAAPSADGASSAETVYLGTLAAAAVAMAAAAAPRPAVEAGLGAVLTVTALWAVPAGEGRAAAVGLLLVGLFAAAAARRLARDGGVPEPAAAVPLSLGAQALLRGERWLGPLLALQALVSLVALPVAGGIAAWALTRRAPAAAVGLAVATVLLLAPGFDVAVVLTLVALAAGQAVADAEVPRRRRMAALALLAIPMAWEPRVGAVAAAAGLALGGGPAGPLSALAAAGLAVLFPVRSWSEAWALLSWVPLLLPSVAAPGRDRGRLAAALALLIAGARVVPGPAALAAPLAFLALLLPTDGPLAAGQRVWTGALWAATALLASYPWLRQAPLADALGFLDLEPGWGAAAVTLVAAGALALAFRGSRLPVPLVAGGLLLVALAAVPRAGRVLVEGDPVVVDAGRSRRALILDDEPPVTEVVIDSQLVNAAGVAPGTPVATFRLLDAGEVLHQRRFRAGFETGEWAARRPDVVPLPGGAAPAPWRTRVDPGGFFAATYRVRWRLPPGTRAARVEVERSPELEPGVGLLLRRVELRP